MELRRAEPPWAGLSGEAIQDQYPISAISLSPDGKRFVYSASEGAGVQPAMWLYDLGVPGHPARLVLGRPSAGGRAGANSTFILGWNGASRLIYGARTGTGAVAIEASNLNGGATKIADLNVEGNLYLSPSGNFLASEGPLGSIAVIDVRGGARPVSVRELAGCPARFRGAGAHVDYGFVAWSPDERKIAILAHVCPSQSDFPFRWIEGDLVVADVSRDEQKLIASAAVAAQWSPDGRRLAVVTVNSSDGFRYLTLRLIDAESGHTLSTVPIPGSEERLSADADYRWLLRWSGDGSRLLVGNYSGKLWVIPLRNLRPILIAEGLRLRPLPVDKVEFLLEGEQLEPPAPSIPFDFRSLYLVRLPD